MEDLVGNSKAILITYLAIKKSTNSLKMHVLNCIYLIISLPIGMIYFVFSV